MTRQRRHVFIEAAAVKRSEDARERNAAAKNERKLSRDRRITRSPFVIPCSSIVAPVESPSIPRSSLSRSVPRTRLA
jgi:hypothetical protein